MSIHYAPEVSKADYLSLTKLFFRWRGSIWKLVYIEFIAWILLYAILSLIYRLALDETSRELFEKLVKYCDANDDLIPLTFMLGAFVTLVLQRWWSVVSNIGFIDNLALMISNYIRGNDERAIMFKRNIIRYMCLVQAMVYRTISPPVKRKYPTLQSLVDAGYLEPCEVDLIAENNFYQSVSWALALARQARDENIIKSDQALQDIFDICLKFRWSQITLWYYNWVPVPLANTQVVFLSVRFYFLLAVIGRQFIIKQDSTSDWEIDLYFPVISVLQLTFHIAWLKVAEALLNPCGDDDEDFDFEWFLARNLRQALAIMDEKNCIPPPLGFDKFWREAKKKENLFRKHENPKPLNAILSKFMSPLVERFPPKEIGKQEFEASKPNETVSINDKTGQMDSRMGFRVGEETSGVLLLKIDDSVLN